MIQFETGSTHSAKVVMTNPTSGGFDYLAILFMGVNQVAMAQTTFHLNAGESKEISFSVVMPTTAGEYPVYLSVFSGTVLLAHYQSTENVTIVAPAVAEFYMPSKISGKAKYAPLLDWNYWYVDFWIFITNKGNAAGTVSLTYYDTMGFIQGTMGLALGPGETKEWRVGAGKRIDFTRTGAYSITLIGDWVGNNTASITVDRSKLLYVRGSDWVDV